MALQVFQLTAAAQKAPGEAKSHTASKKDFGTILENIKSPRGNNLTDEAKGENTEALLIQALNLLNIDISMKDLEILLNEELPALIQNFETFHLDVKLPTDELNRYWQAILAEFNATGEINEENVEKFYLALKKAISPGAELDLKSLKAAIEEVLEEPNLKHKAFDDNYLKENSSIAYEAKSLEASENHKNEKVNIFQVNQKTKTDISTKEKLPQNKEVIEAKDNTTGYDKLQDYNQLPRDSNLSQSEEIIFYTTQTSNSQITSQTAINQPDSNMVTQPLEKYDTQDIFQQLTDQVRFAIKGDVQEVRVRLKPDYLGEVLIKVISDKGKLKAELFVANSQVRSILKTHALDLQNQIRQQGYNFSEINVYEIAEGFEMGTFNDQSSSNNHFTGKRNKTGFYRQQEENPIAVADNFSLWENTSNVNLMA